MTTSCIYQIENQINRKKYIGSAVNLQKRWTVHLSTLRRGQHRNRYLQRAFDKYGEKAFIFSILEETESENLIEREQFYLDTLNPEYNISSTAGSSLGVRYTNEARAKIGEAHKGEHLSVETRAKMRAAKIGKRNYNYGKHRSVETRAKIGAANTGRHPSTKAREKMSEAHKSEHLSVETRAKMSKAQMGKHHSIETRAKISKAQMGKHHSAEARLKMSKARVGKHHSAATKYKISEARKAYWRRIHEINNQ